MTPLAWAILAVGLDDLFVVAVWVWLKCRGRQSWRSEQSRDRRERSNTPEKSIAIFVPLWREAGVIGNMLDHNVHAIRHSNFHFFVGVYPNDDRTIRAVQEASDRHSRVHVALCPHDGPTSKADCLNWIYQRMLLFEEETGVRFGLVVTHDAEDLIHPESLRLINRESGRNAMVQVPVLPLRTPWHDVVHGVYIDEFSEYQVKDMRARAVMGSFIPSNGVGTGFRRDALEKLAEHSDNRIFEPACLTEDYENGIRIHQLGFSQCFIPLETHGSLAATREYFPRTWRTAIRQRTRWVTGIALQSWERNGWRGGAAVRYWFWRDRRGLVVCPLGLLANLILVYGVATWMAAEITRTPWGLTRFTTHSWLLPITLSLSAMQIAFRMGCVGRLYGWWFALAVPFRIPVANAINSIASLSALARYAAARIRNQPLRWIKTEHTYPTREALLLHKRKLGEVLVTANWISSGQLEQALDTQPEGVRIGEHLVSLGQLSEEDLYDAISLQQGLPALRLNRRDISSRAIRALPRELSHRWKVLPYRIAGGSLLLASPEIPNEEMTRDLGGFTQLSLRFQLMTPRNFEKLCSELK